MIDINTHKVIDMIESREKDVVSKWLSSFPNINIISRDGSLKYKEAITLSNPNIIQVSDKFHIIKNLTEYCSKYIKSYMKNCFEIFSDKPFNIIDTKIKYKFDTKWELINYVKNLYLKKDYSIKKIESALGLNYRTIKKYIEIDESLKDKYQKKTKIFSENETKLQNKLNLQKEIKDLIQKGLSQRKIALILKISRQTVKKYIETDDLQDGRLGASRKNKLSPYFKVIQDLLAKNYTKSKIYEIIKLQGYSGCKSALYGYLSRELRNQKLFKVEKRTELIQRKNVLNLLYNPSNKNDSISENQLNEIFKIYPNLKEIINVVDSF